MFMEGEAVMRNISYKDSDKMEQLVRENEKLKRDLESVSYQKDSLMKVIMNRTEGEAEVERLLVEENQELKIKIAEIKKQLSVAGQEIEKLNDIIGDLEEKLSMYMRGSNDWEETVNQNETNGQVKEILIEENQNLKDEIIDLKNQLSVANKREQEIGELNRTIEDLQERLSILTKGCNWKTAVHQNVLKSMGVSAQALCYAVKGYSVKEIVQELNDEVTERTVYRALSVKEDTDLQRITTILHQFKEVFDSHDVTEDDVLKWFHALRTKKLGYVTKVVEL